LEAERAASLLQVLLKPTLTYGKEKPGDSHPIINEWGWDCGSQPGGGGAEPGHGQSEMP
jgi:hypothetical protein